MDKEDILVCATAFTVASAGVLMLALVPSALGIKGVQTAQRFSLMADGHRAISLAKTYDAKAAAMAIKAVAKEIL